MTTFSLVAPVREPTASTVLTTSRPLVTAPKTTCFPSSQAVSAVQRKNCEPVDGWMDGWMDGLVRVCVFGLIGDWNGMQWTLEWLIDRWIDGLIDQGIVGASYKQHPPPPPPAPHHA